MLSLSDAGDLLLQKIFSSLLFLGSHLFTVVGGADRTARFSLLLSSTLAIVRVLKENKMKKKGQTNPNQRNRLPLLQLPLSFAARVPINEFLSTVRQASCQPPLLLVEVHCPTLSSSSDKARQVEPDRMRKGKEQATSPFLFFYF